MNQRIYILARYKSIQDLVLFKKDKIIIII